MLTSIIINYLEFTLNTPPLLFRRLPPQSNYPLFTLYKKNTFILVFNFNKEWYFTIVFFFKNSHLFYTLKNLKTINNYSKGA